MLASPSSCANSAETPRQATLVGARPGGDATAASAASAASAPAMTLSISGTASAGAIVAAMPASAAPPRITQSRPARGADAGAAQQCERGARVGGELRARRRDDVDAADVLVELERARQPREHRLPGGAAGDDREAAVTRRCAHRRFGQADDRQRRRLAQRLDPRVAEAADQDGVGRAVDRGMRGIGVERGVRGNGEARLAGDVAGAEARARRLDLDRRAGRGLDVAAQGLGDRRRRVRIDDEQLHVAATARRRLRPARLARSQATLLRAIAITSSETPVVIVPRA